MATAINENLRIIKNKAESFANKYLGCRQDLYTLDQFPYDIWKKMGKENLLGLCLPKEQGGLGEGYLAMAVTGEALVASGHNMGIVLAWLIHLLTARFLILEFGNKIQNDALLPDMASGRITASIAVSEPDRGAHPGNLETSVGSDGKNYILNGEKTYLTNGPIADLFIVFAVSGNEKGKNRFSALLVPKNTAGLSISKPMEINFLRPASHCSIKLENCVIPFSMCLGKKDSAYEKMVIPFRELEDALIMGPIAGGLTWQLEIFLNLIRMKKISITSDLQENLGRFYSLLSSLRIIAYETAAMLDSHNEHHEFLPLIITSRTVLKDAQSLFLKLLSMTNLKKNTGLDRITQDLNHFVKTGYISRIKQRKLGKQLL